jgi:iron-sulfur cluster assembly protein
MADVPQTDNQDTPWLTITPAAAARVRQLLVERNLEGCALRVFVQGGGCSGLSYGMGFEPQIHPQDNVIESDGVTLVIDPTSLLYMHGAEIDYVDDLMGGGFAIHNPNAVSTCGCGQSFQTTKGDQSAPPPGGCRGCS